MILFHMILLTNNAGSVSILAFSSGYSAFKFAILIYSYWEMLISWHSGEISCAAPSEADGDQVHAQRAKRSLICNVLRCTIRQLVWLLLLHTCPLDPSRADSTPSGLSPAYRPQGQITHRSPSWHPQLRVMVLNL